MVDPANGFRRAVSALLKDGEDMRRSMMLAEPHADSPARTELDMAKAQLGSSAAVERAIRLVDLWTLLEAEHLRGIGILIDDGTTVFPIFPLLRAVIEHAAWVCWILDHNAETRARAIRAALAQLRSDQEIVGVAKRWAGTGNEVYTKAKRSLERTRDSLERDFGDLDIGTATIEGQKIASPTEVIEHFGACIGGNSREWLGTYAYLCGTATHPSENAFEFVEADADGRVHLVLTEDFTNRMVRVGISAFTHSLEHLAAYLGWPRDPLREYERRSEDVLRRQPGEVDQ
jgi:hypothetical protein